ncbi:MAG: hypothetical protein R3C20_00155 [Planctomycetaceae bacterium]
MPTGKATKASDKSMICKKVVTALQKIYGKSLPKLDQPALETIMFAICLEDNSWADAEAAYKRLLEEYFDLNEIRVTSVSELEQTLQPLRFADWKGLRIRSLLRYVFESGYTFEVEKLRRMTQEVAVKTFKKIGDMSPFVRDFSLQHLLSSHVVCLDESMLKASHWLALVPTAMDVTEAGEHLKAGLKKSEVGEFCHLLRCVATDPKFIERFDDMPDEPLDMADAPARLVELQNPPRKKPTRPVADKKVEVAGKSKAVTKKSTATKSSVGKSSTKESAAKATAPVKKTAKKKPSPTKEAPAAKTASKAAKTVKKTAKKK